LFFIDETWRCKVEVQMVLPIGKSHRGCTAAESIPSRPDFGKRNFWMEIFWKGSCGFDFNYTGIRGDPMNTFFICLYFTNVLV
jgi:hypothetical protein